MKRFLPVLVVLLGLLIGTAFAETTTIMMYMCGTDIQNDCVEDMKEITSADPGADTKVIVLAGGAKEWDDSSLKAGELNLFTVAEGKRSAVTSWGKASMGSSETLTKFVSYCEDNYPAERKILILWDHGSSAAYGMCYDEIYDDDALTLKDISDALSSIRSQYPDFHLNIFGCDACLMGSYEMACIAEPYADYFVGSEELEPYLGWYYPNWLNALGSNSSISSRDLAVAIVDSYKYGCERDDPDDYLTLAAIDLSKMEGLKNAMEQLTASLTETVNSSVTSLSRTVRSLYIFGSYDDAGSDMVDLKEFINAVGGVNRDAANAALEALSEVVVTSYANSMVPNANGMSIFLPMENAEYLSEYESDYSVSGIGSYADFVTLFASTTSGSDYTASAESSSPYQLEDAYTDGGFISSVYGYSSDDASNDWDWQDDGYGDDNDYGYGYGGGFGSDGINITIAGSAGDNSDSTSSNGSVSLTIAGTQSGTNTSNITIAGSASATPAPESVITIAGSASAATAAPASTTTITIAGSASAPTATPAPGTITIAGTTAAPESQPDEPETTAAPVQTSVTVEVPQEVTSSTAFCVDLSEDDMENLANAELHLFMDYTEASDTGIYLIDLGRVRDTWIDWNSGRVDALFNGTWPTIGGLPVVMIDQSKTDYARRALIPVVLNGEKETYLVVRFLHGASEGEILGTSDGWNDNGLPVRGITPLTVGDTFTPVFTTLYSEDANAKIDEMSTETFTLGEDSEMIITWDGTQTVSYTELNAGNYRIAFRLNDVFGGYTDTQLMTVTLS